MNLNRRHMIQAIGSTIIAGAVPAFVVGLIPHQYGSSGNKIRGFDSSPVVAMSDFNLGEFLKVIQNTGIRRQLSENSHIWNNVKRLK